METSGKKWVVISLGGSIICPDEIDTDFLKSFVEIIKNGVARGENFAIITGGGRVSRKYTEALKTMIEPSVTELDWVGIFATRLNAEFIKTCFGELSEPLIFLDPTNLALTGKPILVGGGWKPGHSSDGAAVALAETLHAKKLVNLTNIDYVYTADPKKDPTAQKIEKTNWVEFRKLLPEGWQPGINAPFDPVAAKMAEDIGLEVVVMNGRNIPNFEAYIEGKEFLGTVIS